MRFRNILQILLQNLKEIKILPKNTFLSYHVSVMENTMHKNNCKLVCNSSFWQYRSLQIKIKCCRKGGQNKSQYTKGATKNSYDSNWNHLVLKHIFPTILSHRGNSHQPTMALHQPNKQTTIKYSVRPCHDPGVFHAV